MDLKKLTVAICILWLLIISIWVIKSEIIMYNGREILLETVPVDPRDILMGDYVILNYNKKESQKNLVLDQVYGKIKSLSIATSFKKNTWDEMLNNDMKEVDIKARKYQLPANSVSHMDVYKIECELPLKIGRAHV